MEFWNKLTKQQKRNAFITLGIVALVLFLYFFAKKQGKDDAEQKQLIEKLKEAPTVALPNSGSGIPIGWSAGPTATKLYISMKGAGTYENDFFNALDNLTKDQIAATYNKFNQMYQKKTGYSLVEWIQGDFSGSDLSRALAYFDGLF